LPPVRLSLADLAAFHRLFRQDYRNPGSERSFERWPFKSRFRSARLQLAVARLGPVPAQPAELAVLVRLGGLVIFLAEQLHVTPLRRSCSYTVGQSGSGLAEPLAPVLPARLSSHVTNSTSGLPSGKGQVSPAASALCR
jgi:hypothetical protein